MCAQRLSASEVFALRFNIWYQLSIGMCSTPFGIRGICTRSIKSRSIGMRCAQRLSASEVFALALTQKDRLRETSAQRLSASEVFAHASTRASMELNCCAQRLSASEVFAHCLEAVIVRIFSLCSTPFGIRGICTVFLRFSCVSRFVCSTPFGIRGICTQMYTVFACKTAMCSTPFGIRGICTN